MGNQYFVFWDDNFFGDVEYATRLMAVLKGLRQRWSAPVSIDRSADKRLLRLARDSGCVYLLIGLKTFSEARLASVNKSFNRVAHYRQTIELIHQHRISVQAGVVFGFDADTRDVCADSLHTCEELGIDDVTVSLLTPLPGAALHEQIQHEGRLLPLDWDWFIGKRMAVSWTNLWHNLLVNRLQVVTLAGTKPQQRSVLNDA